MTNSHYYQRIRSLVDLVYIQYSLDPIYLDLGLHRRKPFVLVPIIADWLLPTPTLWEEAYFIILQNDLLAGLMLVRMYLWFSILFSLIFFIYTHNIIDFTRCIFDKWLLIAKCLLLIVTRQWNGCIHIHWLCMILLWKRRWRHRWL